VNVGFGEIYKFSWFGNANESNGWGFIYPIIAKGSYLLSSIVEFFSDGSITSSDQTII
jgi:hypothetical protein